jgi:hypothetical protein
MNNVPRKVVCIGDTCRKGEFCIYSVFAAFQAREMTCSRGRSKQTRNPEVRSKRTGYRQIVQKKRSSKSRKGKTPAAPPKWHAGQPALQCNALKRLETWPDIKEINHFTVAEDQMKPAAVAAASAGSRFGREEKDLRMQPGCRHGEVHGSHLCHHHDHRGNRQFCSPGSANLNQFLVACLPAGLIAMRIVVEE